VSDNALVGNRKNVAPITARYRVVG